MDPNSEPKPEKFKKYRFSQQKVTKKQSEKQEIELSGIEFLFDLFVVPEEDLLLAQEEDKEWSPEKSKMVKQNFFPELSGDLWGVICYHH